MHTCQSIQQEPIPTKGVLSPMAHGLHHSWVLRLHLDDSGVASLDSTVHRKWTVPSALRAWLGQACASNRTLGMLSVLGERGGGHNEAGADLLMCFEIPSTFKPPCQGFP